MGNAREINEIGLHFQRPCSVQACLPLSGTDMVITLLLPKDEELWTFLQPIFWGWGAYKLIYREKMQGVPPYPRTIHRIQESGNHSQNPLNIIEWGKGEKSCLIISHGLRTLTQRLPYQEGPNQAPVLMYPSSQSLERPVGIPNFSWSGTSCSDASEALSLCNFLLWQIPVSKDLVFQISTIIPIADSYLRFSMCQAQHWTLLTTNHV